MVRSSYLICIILFSFASQSSFSQYDTPNSKSVYDNNIAVLDKYVKRPHVLIGEYHLYKSNRDFQISIISFFLKNSHNALVIERGYAEAYLINQAFKENNKSQIDKIYSGDIWIDKKLLVMIMDSIQNKRFHAPAIIGIDYEQSAQFTKLALNDIFFSCGIVRYCNLYDTTKTLEKPRSKSFIQKTFLNDTMAYYYNAINSDDDFEFIKGFDSLSGEIIKQPEKYKNIFFDNCTTIIRCYTSFRMMKYRDCKNSRDESDCLNEREKQLLNNYTNYIIADSLRSIALLGYQHIRKCHYPNEESVFNYPSLASSMIENGIQVVSFFPVYTSKSYKNWFLKNTKFGFNDDQYMYLSSLKRTKAFMLYEIPQTEDWKKIRSLFDIIIVAGKAW